MAANTLKMDANNIVALRKRIQKQNVNVVKSKVSSLEKKIKKYFEVRCSTDPIYYVIPRTLTNYDDFENYISELKIYNGKLTTLLNTAAQLCGQFSEIKFPDFPNPIETEDEDAVTLYKQIKYLLPEHELMFTTDCVSQCEILLVSENFYHPEDGYQNLINILSDIVTNHEHNHTDITLTIISPKYEFDYKTMYTFERTINEYVFEHKKYFKQVLIL